MWSSDLVESVSCEERECSINHCCCLVCSEWCVAVVDKVVDYFLGKLLLSDTAISVSQSILCLICFTILDTLYK